MSPVLYVEFPSLVTHGWQRRLTYLQANEKLQWLIMRKILYTQPRIADIISVLFSLSAYE